MESKFEIKAWRHKKLVCVLMDIARKHKLTWEDFEQNYRGTENVLAQRTTGAARVTGDDFNYFVGQRAPWIDILWVATQSDDGVVSILDS